MKKYNNMINFLSSRALIIICLLINSISAYSQLEPEKCEIDIKSFYSDSYKYKGYCQNNKANGWGNLYLNSNDILFGYFKDNKIQDLYLDYYFSRDSLYRFGPNKGAQFNGPCVDVSFDNYVYERELDNGKPAQYPFTPGVTPGPFFYIPKPNFKLNQKFCDADGYGVKDLSVLIPNSTYIIYLSDREYNSSGDKKWWISVVDLSTNKIIRRFGSNEKPLSLKWRPVFIGFTLNNKPVYKYNGKYFQFDITNGLIKVLQTIPSSIAKRKKFDDSARAITYKDYTIDEDYTKIKLLNDSSYLKIFNKWISPRGYSQNYNLKVINSSCIVRFNKNHEVLDSVEFKGLNIFDFDVEQFSNRVALSYFSKDSAYVSYFNLNTLEFISNIFTKSLLGKASPYGLVRFSNTGLYLLYNNSRGTAVYLGNKMHFAYAGNCGFDDDNDYGFNREDNVLITNNSGAVTAYDLEKKTIIWRYDIGDNDYNSKFIQIKNNIYIISGRALSWEGYKVKENGIELHCIAMPKPLFSVTEFVKNTDDISLSLNTKKIVKDVSVNVKQEEKNQYNESDNLLRSYIGLLYLNALLESSYKYSSGSKSSSRMSSGSSNSNSNSQKVCSSCKPFDDKGWYITDYDYYNKIHKNQRYIKRVGYKRCGRCHGVGTYKENDSRGEIKTCYECKGERFTECKECKGTGYQR